MITNYYKKHFSFLKFKGKERNKKPKRVSDQRIPCPPNQRNNKKSPFINMLINMNICLPVVPHTPWNTIVLKLSE